MASPDSASSPMADAEFSGSVVPSSSPSSLGVEEAERYRFQNPELAHRYNGVLNRGNDTARGDSPTDANEETLSCFAVVLTFWFFVAITVILGVYGPKSMWIGPNSSVLVELNPFFVQRIKVKQLDDLKPGLKLFGFYRSPPLDVIKTWSETHLLSVSANSHKGWAYYLNEGTSLNVSYDIKSQDSSVLLVLAQGAEGFSQWLEEPALPSTTLSWNLIHGSGMVKMKIPRSSSYYVAVGNLNTKDVKVELIITVRTFLYDTTGSFYMCTFGNGECAINVMIPNGNYFVLTSPSLEEERSIEEWHIRISYQPRWLSYIAGTGIIIALMLVGLQCWQRRQCIYADRNSARNDSAGSRRATLLISNKDDDGTSMCSSYESISDEDADSAELSASEGETGSSKRRLCAICFDAPRDCFFLPCGHCVSCFQCGTRIAADSGRCPICCRQMKKVRRIYTV